MKITTNRVYPVRLSSLIHVQEILIHEGGESLMCLLKYKLYANLSLLREREREFKILIICAGSCVVLTKFSIAMFIKLISLQCLMLPKLYGGDIYIIQFSIQNKILFLNIAKKWKMWEGVMLIMLHVRVCIFLYSITTKLSN